MTYYPIPFDLDLTNFRTLRTSWTERSGPPMPRSIGREGWMEYQHQSRVRKHPRTEHGLPKHPTNGLIECPDCEGAGEHTVDHTHNNDPQYDEPVECERCGGEGSIVDGRIDPLVLIRRERVRYRRGSPYSYYRYVQLFNHSYGLTYYRKLPFIGEKK